MENLRSKLILGTAQFGMNYGISNQHGKPESSELNAIFNKAFTSGIKTLDTAQAYGNAITRIGNFIRNEKAMFKVLSKLNGNTAAEFIREAEAQLLELGITSFHCLSLHRFNDAVNEQKCNSLLRLRQENKTKYCGISVYNNSEFERAIDMEWADVIQFPFNLLDNYSLRGSLMQKAKKNGKLLHGRSVFLQGLFFKDPEELSPRFASLKEPIQRIRMVSAENGISIPALSLCYALSQKCLDGVLIGVDTARQLEENISSISDPFTMKISESIDAIEVSDKEILDPTKWN